MLTFRKLDVYRCAIEFLALAAAIGNDAPRGNGALVDQLRRAATSVPLNIAEAAGRVAGSDAVRFFVIARGSTMECVAILDALLVLRALDEQRHQKGCALLERIVSMLIRLCA
jgi:four helix bundle protein